MNISLTLQTFVTVSYNCQVGRCVIVKSAERPVYFPPVFTLILLTLGACNVSMWRHVRASTEYLRGAK